MKKAITTRLSDQLLFDIAWRLRFDQQQSTRWYFDHYGNVLDPVIKRRLVATIQAAGYHHVVVGKVLRLIR